MGAQFRPRWARISRRGAKPARTAAQLRWHVLPRALRNLRQAREMRPRVFLPDLNRLSRLPKVSSTRLRSLARGDGRDLCGWGRAQSSAEEFRYAKKPRRRLAPNRYSRREARYI